MLEDLTPAPMFRAAVEFFNTGDFVYAYEMSEQVWQSAPDAARDFYKGFLQTAAGFARLRQANYAGAVSLLSTGLALLEGFEPVTLGIDVTALVDASARVLEELRRLGPDGITEMSAGPLPRITKV
jgi:predicted metal-dependent hydrolase